MLLFLAYVYVQVLALKGRRRSLWLVAGLLFGATVMVRPGFLLVGTVPILYALISRPDRRGLLLRAALLAAGFAVVVSPWFVRNVVALHRPILLAEHTGDPLLAGIDPYHFEMGWKYRYAGPTYVEYMAHHPVTFGPYAPAYDMAADDYALRAVGEMSRQNPLRVVEWFTLGKIRSMFTRQWEGGIGAMATVTWFTLIAMVAFGFMGMALSIKEERFRLLTWIVVVGVVSLLPFVPEPRYVFEFMPLLAVLAAGAVYRAWTLTAGLTDHGAVSA
jgi:hypothetical protein